MTIVKEASMITSEQLDNLGFELSGHYFEYNDDDDYPSNDKYKGKGTYYLYLFWENESKLNKLQTQPSAYYDYVLWLELNNYNIVHVEIDIYRFDKKTDKGSSHFKELMIMPFFGIKTLNQLKEFIHNFIADEPDALDTWIIAWQK